jgi:hypothetical protein
MVFGLEWTVGGIFFSTFPFSIAPKAGLDLIGGKHVNTFCMLYRSNFSIYFNETWYLPSSAFMGTALTSELIWLRVGTSEGCCECGNEPSGFVQI